jgi:hypothetical protein
MDLASVAKVERNSDIGYPVAVQLTLPEIWELDGLSLAQIAAPPLARDSSEQ